MTGIAMPPGDPDLLEAAAAKLTSAASSWGDLASTTSRAAESIRADAGWTGAAADQQEAFHAALSSGIARGEAPLTSVATAVRSYAGYLRAAQQKVATANSAAEQAQATGNPAHAHAATSAQLDAQTSLTQLDNEGNRAAAAVAAADDDSKGLFSPDGPLRSVIERIHTGLGAVGADGIFWAMGKGADSAKEFMKDLTGKSGTEEEWLEDMLRDAQGSGEPWTEASARWMAKSDAAEAFGSQFLEDTARAGALSAGLRMAGAPLAIAGDVSTMINPAQSGTMGDADRVVAGGNAVLVGADGVGALGGTLGVDALASLSLGPVGVALAVGTGVYLTGSYLYAHWTPFRDVCNDVGHGVVHAGDDIRHGVASAAKTVWHDVF